MDHEVLDRADLQEALAAHRHALVAAANRDTPSTLVHLCALGAALIALASRVSQRLARLERGAGLLLALAVAQGVVGQGCVLEIPGETPVMNDYAAEISVAMANWSSVYDLDGCNARAVTIAVLDERAFQDACHVGADEPTVGCHIRWTRPVRDILVVRAARFSRNTITHEAMHWLARCSGDFTDDQPEHDDPFIWGKDGILARTNYTLGLPHD